MTASTWVVDTTDAAFEQDVLERSRQIPVVVDFWSPTCQPCLRLAPMLEQLAGDFGGKFLLVKAETSANYRWAGEFQVNAIPAVFGVSDGKVADFFEGALPLESLRAWLHHFVEGAQIVQLRQQEATAPAEAEAAYRAILEKHPQEAEAALGLLRVLLAQNKTAACQALLAELEKRGFLEPEAAKIKAQLDLQSLGSAPVDELRRAYAADADNLERQLELAKGLAGAGEHAEALELLLGIVLRDRKGMGERAREFMVEVFRVLPADSPLVGDYRRKLAMALY